MPNLDDILSLISEENEDMYIDMSNFETERLTFDDGRFLEDVKLF